MATINITNLHLADSESSMSVLSDEELVNIQGGWLGVAVGVAGLAVAVYGLHTTESERLVIRKAAKIGGKYALGLA